MIAQTWQLGDKHPDAPWTWEREPFLCPSCGDPSVQWTGTTAVCGMLRGPVPWAWCPPCFERVNEVLGKDCPNYPREMRMLADAGLYDYVAGDS
jgi:hypothetical protein